MQMHRFHTLGRTIGLSAVLAMGLSAMANPADRRITIPAGTRFVGTLRQAISTENTEVGARVSVRTTEPVVVEDTRVPAGLLLRGEVTEAKGGGRVGGESALSIRFDRLSLDGREYRIVAETFRVTGKARPRTA